MCKCVSPPLLIERTSRTSLRVGAFFFLFCFLFSSLHQSVVHPLCLSLSLSFWLNNRHKYSSASFLLFYFYPLLALHHASFFFSRFVGPLSSHPLFAGLLSRHRRASALGTSSATTRAAFAPFLLLFLFLDVAGHVFCTRSRCECFSLFVFSRKFPHIHTERERGRRASAAAAATVVMA